MDKKQEDSDVVAKIVIVDINENALTELTRELRSSNLLNYKPEFITYPINLLSNTFDKLFCLLKEGTFLYHLLHDPGRCVDYLM